MQFPSLSWRLRSALVEDIADRGSQVVINRYAALGFAVDSIDDLDGLVRKVIDTNDAIERSDAGCQVSWCGTRSPAGRDGSAIDRLKYGPGRPWGMPSPP